MQAGNYVRDEQRGKRRVAEQEQRGRREHEPQCAVAGERRQPVLQFADEGSERALTAGLRSRGGCRSDQHHQER